MLTPAEVEAQAIDEQIQKRQGRIHVEFHVGAVVNQEKSDKEGRLIHDDAEFIQIIVPGDRDNIVDRPVREADKLQYKAKYEDFKAGRAQLLTGTPLSLWPSANPSQVADLGFICVRTVEQLAELPDNRLPGMYAPLREKARTFLNASKDSAHVTQMQSELEKRDNQIETMQRQLAAATTAIEELKKQNASPQQAKR